LEKAETRKSTIAGTMVGVVGESHINWGIAGEQRKGKNASHRPTHQPVLSGYLIKHFGVGVGQLGLGLHRNGTDVITPKCT